MIKIKRTFIDMDEVIVNLSEHISCWFKNHPHLKTKYEKYPDHIPGIFRDPKPIEGAIRSIKKMNDTQKYELILATSAPWGNPESSTDKRYWVYQVNSLEYSSKIEG